MIRMLLAAVLSLCVLAWAGELRAQYRIITADAEVSAPCYWIHGSTLHVCESDQSFDLSTVAAIEREGLDPLAAGLHREGLRRYFAHVSWLLDREHELLEKDSKITERLEGMPRNTISRSERTELSGELPGALEELSLGVQRLRQAWGDIRITERRLVQPSRVKSLQFLAWTMALQDRLRYLKTFDPTHRDYALEHMRQAGTFRDSFGRHLEEAAGSMP
ncbi:MAG TPA: hypothetical protein PLR71_03165 [Deltaproteobacteria bacterium]|nr:hypothetical protein [Deltaproteobacteria bacterium]HQI80538.1 hypothetical protein [Deltaproteobacteria bacterium]